VNQVSQVNAKNNARTDFLDLINEYHARSGLSLRDVAQACDLDFTYIHRILSGSRRPRRDVIIALGFAYNLDLGEVDELLLLVGYPPVGRSASKEYRQSIYQN
jgi:transcriptional regulator with XRE-family HTH domain